MKQQLPIFSLIKKIPPLVIFLIPIFLIHFTDSILSFIFPIVVENYSGSNTFLGIVLSLSSVVGILCDLYFPQLLKRRSWRFMLIVAILIELGFLITTYLGQAFQALSLFLIAALIWAIYYELLYFSEQNYVILHEKKSQFTKFWATLYSIAYVTGIIGPIVASILLAKPLGQAALILFALITFALIFAFLSLARFKSQNETMSLPEGQKHKSKFTIFKELRLWGVFSKKLLPIIVIGVALEVIEATFWIIGGLFGQEITQKIDSGFLANANLEWVPLILYSLPMTVGNIIVSRLNITRGKKRTSLIFLFLGSLLLIPIGLVPDQYLLIFVFIFAASFLLSFAGPISEAVYSDLIDRSGEYKEDLVGLAQANSSIAYIFAPILIGVIADATNYHTTFGILGIAGVLVAIILLVITPRKLKIPHQELDQVSEVKK